MFLRVEKLTRRKRSPDYLRYVIPVALVVLLLPAFFFWEDVYYSLAGDAAERLEKRAAHYETILSSENPDKLYDFIEDARRLADIVERENPGSAMTAYYRGLFDFYELTLRLELSAITALELAGRGFLPESRPGDYSGRSIEALAADTAFSIRRALAMDPQLRTRGRAALILVLSEMLATARTDPILEDYLKEADGQSPLLAGVRIWVTLTLKALRGDSEGLERMLPDLKKPGQPMVLTGLDLDFFRAYAAFRGRNYLRALQLIREIKGKAGLTRGQRIEVARMEGEIFLAQNVKETAIKYFQEGYQLSDRLDPLIQERLLELNAL
ncbi:MAG: hypothetical protein HS115_13795 [Spirochaetales bacterium]|nr:hypothetical protein [Spirochaetales bacterium]